MARPPRPRRQKRSDDRALRKEVRRTEALADKLPGGSRDTPIEVDSAAVVEPKARATPCVQCGGELDLRGDQASSTPRGLLREIDLVCRRCHAPRTLWFRVAVRGPN